MVNQVSGVRKTYIGNLEVKEDNGVKELILIAQDLTYYGLDLYKKRNLAELLEALVKELQRTHLFKEVQPILSRLQW